MYKKSVFVWISMFRTISIQEYAKGEPSDLQKTSAFAGDKPTNDYPYYFSSTSWKTCTCSLTRCTYTSVHFQGMHAQQSKFVLWVSVQCETLPCLLKYQEIVHNKRNSKAISKHQTWFSSIVQLWIPEINFTGNDVKKSDRITWVSSGFQDAVLF